MRTPVLLAGLTILALVLRLWALDRVPPGLDPDEASIGYNAYAIARTGRDEYGVPHPLAFRAYGEYKRPVAIYAAVPFIAVLGPTVTAVRLPAALAGTLSVPAMYAVGTLLFRSRRSGLVAAAMLAISPWHLQFTRAAREVAFLLLTLLLMAAALLAAVHTTEHQPVAAKGRLAAGGQQRAGRAASWLSIGAAGAALLAIYSYPGGPLIAPALALLLLVAYAPRVRRAPRRWLIAAAIFAIGALPLVAQLIDGRARARLGQASLLDVPALQQQSQRRLAWDARDGLPGLLQQPWAVAGRAAIDAYLSHFDPTFLFTRGDQEWRHHASDSANLYLWDAPLIALGLLRIARHPRRPPLLVTGGWLLLGPLPAAFAENAPHAVRSIAMLPAWYLAAAAGAPRLWRWLHRRRLHQDWLLLLALSLGYYLLAYYRYYPREHARDWSSGQAEAFRAALAQVESGQYRQIVIARESGFSYANVLYSVGYDPAAYLAQGGTPTAPDAPQRFAPFELRSVDWAKESPQPGVLYVVGSGTGLPGGARVVQRIDDAGGAEALLLVDLAPAR